MFELYGNTELVFYGELPTLTENGSAWLRNFWKKSLGILTEEAENPAPVVLRFTDKLQKESYLRRCTEELILLEAGDFAGFAYGLSDITREAAGLHPYAALRWAFLPRRGKGELEEGTVFCPVPPVPYRGWCVMGEEEPEISFETLIRSHGNLLVTNAPENLSLAAECSLNALPGEGIKWPETITALCFRDGELLFGEGDGVCIPLSGVDPDLPFGSLEEELKKFGRQIFLVITDSLRDRVLPLDEIRTLWQGEDRTPEEKLRMFADFYYSGDEEGKMRLLTEFENRKN